MKYLSHVLTSAVGSVGATVYSKNRNGSYIRKKSIPANPKTAAQQGVRASFSSTSSAWRNLTQAQHAGWSSLGGQMVRTDTLGQAHTLTGAQAHSSINGILAIMGSNPATDAPALEAPAELPSFDLTATLTAGGVFVLQINSPAYAGSVEVKATKPVSAGIHYFSKSAYRLLEVDDNLAATGTSIGPAYTAKYGKPAVGQKIAVSLAGLTATGFKGQEVTATVIVAAA